MDGTIFHPDFKARPYWWEAIEIGGEPEPGELPAKADVVIVGGGLTGLNCAIELGRGGARAVVLEAEEFGFGASTRNGGGVSGGTNLGKGMSGAKGRGDDPEGEALLRAMIGDAAASLTHVEALMEREGIACHYERTGRFVGAFTPRHYDAMAKRVDALQRDGRGRGGHGAARAPAGGDRLRLLLRRHGGRTAAARSTRRSTTAA